MLNQVETSQVMFEQVKSSWEKSNKGGTGPVKLGQVKSKNFWPQYFSDKIFFWTQNIFGHKLFGLKIVLDTKYHCPKILFGPKIFGQKNFFGPKKFSTPDNGCC